MKFRLLDQKRPFRRLGYLCNVERIPSFNFETPNLVFYTSNGCIPNITYDVMNTLLSRKVHDCLTLQIPISSILDLKPSLVKYGGGINSFIGAPEHLSYLIPHNPLSNFPVQKLKKNNLTLFLKKSVKHLNKVEYMDLVEDVCPDIYVSLTDSCSGLESGPNRINKSFDTVVDSMGYCYERHSNSLKLRSKVLISPIVGGYDKNVRERCAKHMANFPVLGYLIDGMYLNETDVPLINHDVVNDLISSTLSYLPENSLRIIHGPWDPNLVLKMIKSGIDIFDTSLPIAAANSGFALTFDFNIADLLEDNVKLKSIYENLFVKPVLVNKAEHEFNYNNYKDIFFKCDYLTYLLDERFSEELTPVFPGCECLCCRNHSKAYIKHLLETKEMLSLVLLTIHNLHHYGQFFKKIRETMRKNE